MGIKSVLVFLVFQAVFAFGKEIKEKDVKKAMKNAVIVIPGWSSNPPYVHITGPGDKQPQMKPTIQYFQQPQYPSYGQSGLVGMNQMRPNPGGMQSPSHMNHMPGHQMGGMPNPGHMNHMPGQMGGMPNPGHMNHLPGQMGGMPNPGHMPGPMGSLPNPGHMSHLSNPMGGMPNQGQMNTLPGQINGMGQPWPVNPGYMNQMGRPMGSPMGNMNPMGWTS